jgi:3-methyladenine DNA glycosylase AlkC
MAPFYYLPHTQFVATRGLAHFELSMRAQYELTKRFSAEASIRPARDLANGGEDGYLNPLGTGSDEEASHGHVPDAL